MNLTKTLRKQGYDLIDGPVRNHTVNQLWLKRPTDEVLFYFNHANEAFISPSALTVQEKPALDVNSSTKNEYKFNLGMSILKDILESLNLTNIDLKTKITSGKQVSISYNNSISQEVPIGLIHNFLSTADFAHPNKVFRKNANRNNILFISGVLLSKNLVVEIETDFQLDADLAGSLNQAANGTLDFSINNSSTLKMVSNGDGYFPIAVKAHRLDFDKSNFSKSKLITDNRKFF